MLKFFIASLSVLVCLTGYQLPAKAMCSLNDDNYINCLNQQRRMDEIEQRQREIQERQDCLSLGSNFCF